MSHKIKIVMVIMAVIAIFLLYKFTQFIHAAANGASNLQQTSPLPSPNDDPDHDGLSNQQEAIWGTDPFNPDTDGDGFKDGEEVNSGHNPLIPGPDDLITSDNLTQQFSELAAAGLVAGDLQPESPNYGQALGQITTEISDSGKSLFAREVTTDALNLVETTQSANEKYVSDSMSLIQNFIKSFNEQYAQLQNNLDTIGAGGFGDQKLQDFYAAQGVRYADLLKEGLSMQTPKTFAPAHAQLVSLIQRMQYISEAIRDGSKDPVKATLAFDTLGGVYETLADFGSAYDQALTRNGLQKPAITPSK